jgi:hypothetical protein
MSLVLQGGELSRGFSDESQASSGAWLNALALAPKVGADCRIAWRRIGPVGDRAARRGARGQSARSGVVKLSGDER